MTTQFIVATDLLRREDLQGGEMTAQVGCTKVPCLAPMSAVAACRLAGVTALEANCRSRSVSCVVRRAMSR